MDIKAAARVRVRRLERLVTGGRRGGDPRAFLFTMFPPQSVGAEVGVWRGGFSAMLLARVRPTTLHLVDPWTYVDDEAHEKSWYGGAEASSQADMDVIAQGVAARFADEIATGRVKLHRAASVVAADQVDDQSLDWVYIDGDHSFDAVRADLGAWWPKLVPGGLLAGDDYCVGDWWGDSVIRAVADFDEDEDDAELVRVAHMQFVFRKR